MRCHIGSKRRRQKMDYMHEPAVQEERVVPSCYIQFVFLFVLPFDRWWKLVTFVNLGQSGGVLDMKPFLVADVVGSEPARSTSALVFLVGRKEMTVSGEFVYLEKAVSICHLLRLESFEFLAVEPHDVSPLVPVGFVCLDLIVVSGTDLANQRLHFSNCKFAFDEEPKRILADLLLPPWR